MNKILFIIFFLCITIQIFTIVELTSINSKLEDQICFDDFQKTDPADFLKSDKQTKCYISYDHNFIYLHWEACIDKNFQKGNFTSRERQPESDYLSCEIITQNDFAYGFKFFPYKNKIDYVRKKDLSIEVSWNSKYSYESNFSDSLWIVEAKIPVNNFRFNEDSNQVWKIILKRFEKYSDATYSYPAITTKMGKSYFQNAQKILIKGKLARNLNIFIRPYLLNNYNLQNSNSNNFDYGADFSIDPTASTKLKLSYNPDFSDIPLDTVTDIYNLKYPNSLTENRYFFIQDFEAFNATNDLFYSRNIMQPQYAMKLNGNWDNFSFALLTSKDSKITDTYETSDSTSYTYTTNYDDLYNIIAFKPKNDVFSSEIALLSRSNAENENHNEVLHLKPIWEFAPGNSIWIKSNLSYLSDLADSKYGYNNAIGYNLDSNENSLSLDYEQISKDYRARMGLVYETNIESFKLDYSHRTSFNKFKIRKINSRFIFCSENSFDEHKYINRFISGSITSYTNYNFAVSLKSTVKDEFYINRFYDQYIVTLSGIWYNFGWFIPDFRFSKLKALVYNEEKCFDMYWLQGAISSEINKFTSIRITSDHIQYLNAKNYYFDDDFWLVNIDTDIAFSENLSCSAGIRLDTYSEDNTIGSFINLQWKLWEHYSITSGYKSSPDPFSNENKQTIYIKNELLF
jgi:hypothetical protein